MNLVTGATGFVGSHIVSQLVQRGEKVRVLARKASVMKNLEGLDVEVVHGDLTDRASVRAAVAGCRRIYHAAADYRLWALDKSVIYLNNVGGTRNVMEAARDAKVERIVYTSTVGALGHVHEGLGADEHTPVTLHDMIGHYKRSKFLAQEVALDFARRGLPVVVVNPSFPVGPFDRKPTPSGKMIVDFLRGKIPAYVDTGMNVVAVEDVAEGHLLAAEKGRSGEKYILGHRNMHLKEVLDLLAQITGLPRAERRVPYWMTYAFGLCSELRGKIRGRPPEVPLESVKLARHFMYFDSGKAVRELGLPQTPVEGAFERAVDWFRSGGYVQNG